MSAFFIVVGFIALIVGVIAAMAGLTMWAWNMVVAGVFAGPVITFWQALAVNILAGLVAGGINRVKSS